MHVFFLRKQKVVGHAKVKSDSGLLIFLLLIGKNTFITIDKIDLCK